MEKDNSNSKKHECYQHVIVLRHGDRIDQIDPLWKTTAARPWDPPLVDEGLARAFSTGKTLKSRLDFPIHRVFISPYLRCVQTASKAIPALFSDAVDKDSDVSVDPSKVKAAIEYGLCEALHWVVTSEEMAREINFNIPELEALLPAGIINRTVKPVFDELPPWEETEACSRARYAHVYKALADKYPYENLLLVTHAEGIAASVSEFLKDNVTVHEIKYCAFSELRRTITKEGQTFNVGEFELLTKGDNSTGITYEALAGNE